MSWALMMHPLGLDCDLLLGLNAFGSVFTVHWSQQVRIGKSMRLWGLTCSCQDLQSLLSCPQWSHCWFIAIVSWKPGFFFPACGWVWDAFGIFWAWNCLSETLTSWLNLRFVSHAWQEGIFEFLSKLSTSWPYSARNAWCCMLANPQNLNIGSMLQCPRTSPFALALQASRHMLVVPNHCNSLYTRLWCGYEAYVASEQGKVVQLATPPRIHYIYRSLLIAMAPVLLGFFLGILLCTYHLDLRRELVSWAQGVTVLGRLIWRTGSSTSTRIDLGNVKKK